MFFTMGINIKKYECNLEIKKCIIFQIKVLVKICSETKFSNLFVSQKLVLRNECTLFIEINQLF